MGSVLALISKAAYAKLETTGGWPTHCPGHVLKIDRYVSKHPTFDVLANDRDAALFLVTVLPRDVLWLVAILERPKLERRGWLAAPNLLETLDLSPLAERLGLQRGDGKLAMRLQTPRVLTPEHVAILRHVEAAMQAAHDKVHFTAKAPKKISKPAPAKKPKPVKSMSPDELARRAAKLKKGTFAFVNARRFDGSSILEQLDAVHQKQFIEAMYAYAGNRQKTAKAALEAHLREQSLRPADFAIELWDVIEGGKKKPSFEYWVQGAGDGQLFTYGKATCPGWIGSTQHSFEAHGDENEKTLALVDALQAASDKCL